MATSTLVYVPPPSKHEATYHSAFFGDWETAEAARTRISPALGGEVANEFRITTLYFEHESVSECDDRRVGKLFARTVSQRDECMFCSFLHHEPS